MGEKWDTISGADLSDSDIEAYDRGELVPWRRGADGILWYRRVAADEQQHPDIHGEADDSFDEPALDDFERMQLQEWADRLRRGGDGDADDV